MARVSMHSTSQLSGATSKQCDASCSEQLRPSPDIHVYVLTEQRWSSMHQAHRTSRDLVCRWKFSHVGTVVAARALVADGSSDMQLSLPTPYNVT